MKFTVKCIGWTNHYVQFNVFDPSNGHCGQLTILANDIFNFLQQNWKGNIDWDNNIPDYVLAYNQPTK